MSRNEKYTKRLFPQGILPSWIGYRKSVQSSTRDPESAFPHQQPAGFLTCRSTPTAAFPVFPVTVPCTLAIRSLLTVTSSYRTYTCFPFTRCPHRTPFPVSERMLARFLLHLIEKGLHHVIQRHRLPIQLVSMLPLVC